MDFDLTEDALALQEGIATFLTGRVPIERVREGVSHELWEELASAGVFSLLIDDFGWRSVAVVFEELGAAGVPGPLVWTLLAAGLIPGAAEGTTMVGGLHWPSSDGPIVIEHPNDIDALLVLDESGIRNCSVPEVSLSDWPTDPLTPVGHCAALGEGELLGSASAARSMEVGGALATAAFCVGLARSCTERSVEYAMNRQQFDRPIASFQAIKHLCAEMAVRAELARHAVYAAAVLLDEAGEGDVMRSVSGAKLLASEAAIMNGRTATQVHGGMGFTWEVDIHLYLKRAWVMETQFGSIATHSDAIAQGLVAAGAWAQ